MDRWMCVGCGTELNEQEAKLEFHTRMEHDPACPGDESFCVNYCDSVQCGLIELMEQDHSN